MAAERDMGFTTRELDGLLQSIIYLEAVKHTEGAEHEGVYSGNSHHWAQQIAADLAGAFIRPLELLELCLVTENKPRLWRAVNAVVTPLVQVRSEKGNYRGNADMLIWAIVDDVVDKLFEHEVPILELLQKEDAHAASVSPYQDSRPVIMRKAMRGDNRP